MQIQNMGNRQGALRRGVYIFLALAVFTAIEYILGLMVAPMAILWLIALIKAGLVVWFFMHLGRVFLSEGGHE